MMTGCGGGSSGPSNPTPTPTPTTTNPIGFVGLYAGGVRFSNNGVTDSFLLRVDSNGSISNANSNDPNVYSGNVSNSGQLRFTTVDAEVGNVTVVIPLTRTGDAVNGTGTFSSSREGAGSARIRLVTPASTFAGTYTGTATVTNDTVPPITVGQTFPVRIVVQSNGIVSFTTLETNVDDRLTAASLINANGAFQLGLEEETEDDDTIVSIITGVVVGNDNITGVITNDEGFRATYTMQRSGPA